MSGYGYPYGSYGGYGGNRGQGGHPSRGYGGLRTGNFAGYGNPEDSDKGDDEYERNPYARSRTYPGYGTSIYGGATSTPYSGYAANLYTNAGQASGNISRRRSMSDRFRGWWAGFSSEFGETIAESSTEEEDDEEEEAPVSFRPRRQRGGPGPSTFAVPPQSADRYSVPGPPPPPETPSRSRNRRHEPENFYQPRPETRDRWSMNWTNIEPPPLRRRRERNQRRAAERRAATYVRPDDTEPYMMFGALNPEWNPNYLFRPGAG